MTERSVPELPARSQWHDLRLTWAAMGDDISRVYAEADLGFIDREFVKELIHLHLRGPMTVATLARSVDRAPAKVARKVSEMQTLGLVETVPTGDADPDVAVTPKAEQLIDPIMAEWEATQSAIAEIEAELPYPVSRAAADLANVLEHKTFYSRIQHMLRADPRWDSDSPPSGP